VKPTDWRFIKQLGDVVGARTINRLIHPSSLSASISAVRVRIGGKPRAIGKIDPPGCRESVASAIRQYADGAIKQSLATDFQTY
jgi:hypothetical protein